MLSKTEFIIELIYSLYKFRYVQIEFVKRMYDI